MKPKQQKQVIDFYNNSTLNQKMYFITLCSDLITIPIPTLKEKGDAYIDVHTLEKECPCAPNGTTIQLHTEEFRKFSEKKKL